MTNLYVQIEAKDFHTRLKSTNPIGLEAKGKYEDPVIKKGSSRVTWSEQQAMSPHEHQSGSLHNLEAQPVIVLVELAWGYSPY